MKTLKITVKTFYGFEEILKEELNELGYPKVEIMNRAIQLEGTWEDVYRLNYRCRLAIAVLVEVKSFFVHREQDLYKEAMKIDWTRFFDVDTTFAVKGAVFSTLFRHTQYPLLLLKDAIVDTFRKKYDKRPDVNAKAPQVVFDIYIKDKQVVVSINTNGKPLFQRGYRQETGDAPINEVLAAGLLRLSGWDRKSTFIDPMCGSGTIAIEAALWAADIPAMIERRHYAFKNFKMYEPETWKKIQQEGNHRPQSLGFDILASDIDAAMVQNAKRNARIAPIGNMIQFDIADVTTLKAIAEKGTLICNPPYGDRMGEDVIPLYEKLGDTFKKSFVGFHCWVISSNMEALKNIGLKPSQKHKVFNGNLECSFREFQVFEGARIDHLRKEKGEDFEEIEKPKRRKKEKEENVIRPASERPKASEKVKKSVSESQPKEEVYVQTPEPKQEKKAAPHTSKKTNVSSKYGRSSYAQRSKYGSRNDELKETPTPKPTKKEEAPQQEDSSSLKNKIEEMKRKREE